VTAVSERGRLWAERQDPASPQGVLIEAWRRYRALDGPLQSALLALYVLIAVIPALLVLEEYLDPNPGALAHHLVHHYGLNAPTAALLRSVLSETRAHELGSALFAIAGALFFGLGFGRVLQLVHSRAWRIPLQSKQTDQALYATVLLGVYGLLFLLLLQLSELKGSPRWVELTLSVGWIALLAGFFVWAPWLLTHKLVTRRDLLPGAVATALGLIALMVVSRFVMQFWVDLYASDYGGLGVILALYFWLGLVSAVIVMSASLAPALARRRRERE
jgi:membrane protein